MSFWQVQDKVNKEIITAATSTCERDDCCISAQIGTTTCAGMSDYYDKAGQLHINDPNRMDVDLCCSECWKMWNVERKGDEIHVNVK